MPLRPFVWIIDQSCDCCNGDYRLEFLWKKMVSCHLSSPTILIMNEIYFVNCMEAKSIIVRIIVKIKFSCDYKSGDMHL